MIKTIGIYTRVSTSKQKVEPQAEKLRKYCKERGYKIFKEYIDDGVSGSSIDQRKQFQMLIKDAKENKFDAIAVTSLDRFGRSIQDLVNTIAELEILGIKFISLKENIDTSSAQGRLQFHIMSAFAEFEREIIKERLKEGRERAEEKGKICHRPEKELPKQKIIEYLEKGVSITGIAKIVGVSRGTIYRRLQKWGKVV